MHNRHITAAAVVSTGLVLLTPAVAGATNSPPPPGSASAVAAQVGQIVALSTTDAKAGPTGPAASAGAVTVNGTAPSSQFGGAQEGKGTSSGHLIDTGKTPAGRGQVTPWSASGAQEGGVNRADADAALARLILGDGALTVNVVQSSSHATYQGAGSTGNSSTDGATVDAGELSVVVLHSEASSSGTGASWVADINGTRVLTSDDTNGRCTLTLPGLLALDCLTASGGVGEAAASLLRATVGSGDRGLSAAAWQAGAKAGPAGATVLGETGLERAPAPAPAAPIAAPAGLAFTGFGVQFAASVGAALMAFGFALMVPARVRRLVTVARAAQ